MDGSSLESLRDCTPPLPCALGKDKRDTLHLGSVAPGSRSSHSSPSMVEQRVSSRLSTRVEAGLGFVNGARGETVLI